MRRFIPALIRKTLRLEERPIWQPWEIPMGSWVEVEINQTCLICPLLFWPHTCPRQISFAPVHYFNGPCSPLQKESPVTHSIPANIPPAGIIPTLKTNFQTSISQHIFQTAPPVRFYPAKTRLSRSHLSISQWLVL